MKKLLPILLVLLNTTFTKAQVIDTTGLWYVTTASFGPGQPSAWTEQYYFEGTLAHDNKTYNKLWIKYPYDPAMEYGAIYEENNQVFYLETWDSSTHLLYDFNLSIGDTLTSTYKSYTILNIDSILLDNGFHKRQTTTSCWGLTDTIVSGIGSLSGLLYPSYQCVLDGGQTFVSCFFSNNVQTYHSHPNIGYYYPETCNFNGPLSIKNTSDQRAYSISPNPSVGIFNLNIPYSENVSFTVRDLLGRIVYFTNNANSENVINLSAEPKGIYVLNVISIGVNYREKLIVE